MTAEYARILVTSALPYANGPIHLGHLAGAYLPGDVFCRYQRLRGQDVVYVCGSDEHGAAIVIQARKEGVSPKDIVDRYHSRAAKAFADFGMSFDHYGRTSGETHAKTARDWFRAMATKGAFVLKTEEQPYDPEAKLFLADRFVTGTCPKCQNPSAYGDQCEKCGSALSATELIDPKSTLSDATPEWRETTHWYLPLGREQEKLEAWLATKDYWKPNVLGQVKSWLTAGLADRAMTRDLPWGVPVPEDVAEAAGVSAEGKVMYVWFDAPIGYVSATREWAEARGEPERWKDYWQSEDTRLLHFIGKDNIVFHTLSFPAMLMLHGGYVLPENVPANEFLNLEGSKLSTSRGWAVWLEEALEAFPADYLRYALLCMLPETRDADFTWEEFAAHVNNELADNLGNFVNRTVAFCAKYQGGAVPALDADEADEAALAALAEFPARIGALIDASRMREATQELMALGRLGNKYFNDGAPWATRKTDEARCGSTIHVSLQICAALSILAEPFLPFTAAAIREILKLGGVRPSGPSEETGGLGWDDAGRPLLEAGHALGDPQILVQKVEPAAVQAQLELLETRSAAAKLAASGGAPYTPVRETITYEDFAKLDFRVGHVVAAERVKKSKKLIRCEVDLGFEKRQVLAGVAEHMSAEDLLGKRVIVVANLAPRKMVGLESQGMLLMAEDREGALTMLTADSEPGSTVS